MSSLEILRLRERIAQLERRLQAQERSSNQTPRSSRPTIPDPPIFRGSFDGIKFEEWACMINLKLQTSPVKSFDDKMKIWYIATRTAGRAIDCIKPRLPIADVTENDTRPNQDQGVYTSPQELLIDLKREFGGKPSDCVIQ